MRYLYNTLVGVTLFCACNGGKERKIEEDRMEATREKLNVNYVDTMMLRKTTFQKQIICNGKLRAVSKSDLTMPVNGILRSIYVGNGTYVKKGDLLAVVDREEAEIELKKAEQQVERTYIDLLDKLIGQGYEADTSAIPLAIFKRAKITSGYTSALEQEASARRRIANCHLYAPYGGRVANMNSKEHQRTDKFCTLIDDSFFDVEFNILEAEMGMSRVGQRVIVTPFIDDQRQFSGTVSEINPLIDEKGQITIRAKIKNESGYLLEGMNVRVVLENNQPNMYVVPKDAVVLRDGYYVLFRYSGGEAMWTYVDVMYSNLDSYAVTGNKVKQTEIKENDIIITSGNLNLADGTSVVPRAKDKE
ncbi:MAG: efflux RND transporter periplasmic adaptor subunit [Marinifilaceae bacterium]